MLLVLFGVPWPYLARLPGIPEHGRDWLFDYFGQPPFLGILFAQAGNVFCWGAVLASTFLFRSAATVWFPAVLGFGFCFYHHSQLDLASDAQAGIGLFFIPVASVGPTAVGVLVGYVIEKWRWRANTLY
ncbi:MAG: hypothetical protein AAGG38_10980 [Planctomycetota bacterium]